MGAALLVLEGVRMPELGPHEIGISLVIDDLPPMSALDQSLNKFRVISITNINLECKLTQRGPQLEIKPNPIRIVDLKEIIVESLHLLLEDCLIAAILIVPNCVVARLDG
jgi:hypothetical protein